MILFFVDSKKLSIRYISFVGSVKFEVSGVETVVSKTLLPSEVQIVPRAQREITCWHVEALRELILV